MEEAKSRVRRGPKPKADRGTNTGFRINDRTRFELELAQPFVGAHSMQEILTIAIDEFITRMNDVPGFNEACAAAEANQRQRAGVHTLGQPDEPTIGG